MQHEFAADPFLQGMMMIDPSSFSTDSRRETEGQTLAQYAAEQNAKRPLGDPMELDTEFLNSFEHLGVQISRDDALAALREVFGNPDTSAIGDKVPGVREEWSLCYAINPEILAVGYNEHGNIKPKLDTLRVYPGASLGASNNLEEEFHFFEVYTPGNDPAFSCVRLNPETRSRQEIFSALKPVGIVDLMKSILDPEEKEVIPTERLALLVYGLQTYVPDKRVIEKLEEPAHEEIRKELGDDVDLYTNTKTLSPETKLYLSLIFAAQLKYVTARDFVTSFCGSGGIDCIYTPSGVVGDMGIRAEELKYIFEHGDEALAAVRAYFEGGVDMYNLQARVKSGGGCYEFDQYIKHHSN